MIVVEKKKVQLEASWLLHLEKEFEKEYMKNLKLFLSQEMANYKIYPPTSEIFNAFNRTPFSKLRVVILGQDPYHGPSQAHGLSFSVKRGMKPPPSLMNIFKELKESLNLPKPSHGCLESWSEQGVFLLNTVLTVREDQPNSHAGQGWEIFTDKAIEILNKEKESLVFLLWGSLARKKAEKLDRTKHLVLETTHPSPLSAHRGFLGSGHFKKCNEYLISKGLKEIDWSLT
jgi:uracil-DNA glycosylase